METAGTEGENGLFIPVCPHGYFGLYGRCFTVKNAKAAASVFRSSFPDRKKDGYVRCPEKTASGRLFIDIRRENC